MFAKRSCLLWPRRVKRRSAVEMGSCLSPAWRLALITRPGHGVHDRCGATCMVNVGRASPHRLTTLRSQNEAFATPCRRSADTRLYAAHQLIFLSMAVDFLQLRIERPQPDALAP